MPHRMLIAAFVVVAVASAIFAAEPASRSVPRKKIAIIANYWDEYCHANLYASRYFTGFPVDEGVLPPEVDVAAIYIAQTKGDDMGHQLAARAGIKVYPTITDALTLGGEKLAVDGVLYIGEHGKYQQSKYGQRMYPHLNHLEEIFRCFEASGRVVPVFNDKEIAYNWLDTKWIYDRAAMLKVPMMAGSCLTVTYRKPVLVHPIGFEPKEAITVGYGNMTAYAFHTLEILECMLERRKGGETGVRSVQALEGPAVFAAAREGKVPMDLIEAACALAPNRKAASLAEGDPKPTLIRVEYADDTLGCALIATRYVGEFWGYAARVNGKIEACEFVTPPKPVYAYFSYMNLNVQRMFVTGRPQMPFERTVLTTGILYAAVESLAQGGKELPTPHLEQVRYQPYDFEPIWPKAEAARGAAIGPWPPAGFEFMGPKNMTDDVKKRLGLGVK